LKCIFNGILGSIICELFQNVKKLNNQNKTHKLLKDDG